MTTERENQNAIPIDTKNVDQYARKIRTKSVAK